MAHACPDCGSACYCGGDIDDIDLGEVDNCSCCLSEVFGRAEDDDDYDDGFYLNGGKHEQN